MRRCGSWRGYINLIIALKKSHVYFCAIKAAKVMILVFANDFKDNKSLSSVIKCVALLA